MLDRVKADFLQARKDKAKTKISILSVVLGEYETQLINGKNPEILAIIKKTLKGIEESIAHSKSINLKLEHERDILLEYLPKQLTEEELTCIIRTFIETRSVVNMGQVMSMLKNEYADQYDGKLASTIAKTFL